MNERKPTQLASIAPFFIVRDLQAALEFYQTKLGFEVQVLTPKESPFFATIRRDSIEILLKEIGPMTPPQPNPIQHEWAKWDALVSTANPDNLYEEFKENGVDFLLPITDTDDGLRAFEVRDIDGYVLCFARPL